MIENYFQIKNKYQVENKVFLRYLHYYVVHYFVHYGFHVGRQRPRSIFVVLNPSLSTSYFRSHLYSGLCLKIAYIMMIRLLLLLLLLLVSSMLCVCVLCAVLLPWHRMLCILKGARTSGRRKVHEPAARCRQCPNMYTTCFCACRAHGNFFFFHYRSGWFDVIVIGPRSIETNLYFCSRSFWAWNWVVTKCSFSHSGHWKHRQKCINDFDHTLKKTPSIEVM